MKPRHRCQRITMTIIMGMILLILPVSPAMAENVRRIVVEGATVLNFDELTDRYLGYMSSRDMEDLAAQITDEYLSHGYLLSRVVDTSFQDGTLRIIVREGRIRSVQVDGLDEERGRELARFMVPRGGIIYNQDAMERRAMEARGEFSLGDIRVTAQERAEGGLRLVLTVSGGADAAAPPDEEEGKKKRKGKFYASVTWDMFYGVTPLVGYITPAGSAVLDMSALAGINSEGLRRVEGRFYSYFGPPGDGLTYFLGVRGYRTIDVWQSLDLDYMTYGGEPEGGVMWHRGFLTLTGALCERILGGRDYPSFPDVFHETRLRGQLSLRGDERQATGDRDELTIDLFGGRESLGDSFHGGMSMTGRAFLCPFSRVCFLPWASVSADTSGRRLFHTYVFDMDLPGFFDNYTASRQKNVAGCALEFELSRNYIFLGPLIAGGIFLNEEHDWERRTGTGVRGRLTGKRFTVVLCYAWSTVRNPSKGGLYLSVEGRF